MSRRTSIAMLGAVIEEAYADPGKGRSAPHNQGVHQITAEPLEDPQHWAMTWRAHVRKSAGRETADIG